MVVAYYDGDRLDLGEMVREQFFLAVPLRRLCREDCRGLCPTCGANRNLTDVRLPAGGRRTRACAPAQAVRQGLGDGAVLSRAAERTGPRPPAGR